MSHFVADIGGTNIRLARVSDGKVVDIKKYLCREFETIGDAITNYFDSSPEHTFTHGCLAIACPVNSDEVAMTNHSWRFSKTTLKQQLKLTQLCVINDFTAVAHSLPVLTPQQLVKIGHGNVNQRGNIAVFGPGTGLGVEHLTYTSSGWQTLDGEGGHVDFAPIDELDVVIWRHLVSLHGRASAEEVMSGRGIVNIYNALCDHYGEPKRYTEASDISQRAVSKECEMCDKALAQFCRIMGSFAGNLALNLATTGGIFIGGGIASRFTDYLKQSDFRERFLAKGHMYSYIKDIPTFVIAEPDHGLLGASAYLKQHIEG